MTNRIWEEGGTYQSRSLTVYCPERAASEGATTGQLKYLYSYFSLCFFLCIFRHLSARVDLLWWLLLLRKSRMRHMVNR